MSCAGSEAAVRSGFKSPLHCQIRCPSIQDWLPARSPVRPRRAHRSGLRDSVFLKTRLRPQTEDIHSSRAGELIAERGMFQRQ